MDSSQSNRQQEYLYRAATALTEEFALDVQPQNLLYSYGFPKGRGGRGKIIGQCWNAPKPDGYDGAIFIHPCQFTTPLDVLHVLLHELIHAEHPTAGHKGEFVKECKRVGLVKPWTSTTASAETAERLNAIAATLGDFPNAGFDSNAAAKERKGSRLRKWECACGVKVRVASDDFAATCGLCDEPFERAD